MLKIFHQNHTYFGKFVRYFVKILLLKYKKKIAYFVKHVKDISPKSYIFWQIWGRGGISPS
jgi:hypothetical protein